MRIVFAGGGTGGHIYPGIAVADETKAYAEGHRIPVEIYWIGNRAGMDRAIVEKNLLSEGGSITAFIGIPCGKLRRYISLQNFVDIFKIGAGFFKALWVLMKLKPDCLFSKGGFVSVPPCRAARLLRIPYYTHECDFTPGLATRLNAKGARRILLSYEETAAYFKGKLTEKCLVTGNPVRPVFYRDNAAAGRAFLDIPAESPKPVLLVIGGSLGAKQINTLITENLVWLKEHFLVVHQTGKSFAEENPELMQADECYRPFAFIYQEMPAVMQAADIVLSRAGANSLWEAATCAKALVLIPLSGSGTRGDQVDNARYFEKHGAALVLAGNNADGGHLRQALESLLPVANREALSSACRKLCGTEKPAEKIAQIILQGVQNDLTNH